MEAPVGVVLVQLRVHGHHLRLHPDAKLEPQVVDVPHKAIEAVGQLGPVREPVAQPSSRVIALSKPAIVKHDHLNARLGRHTPNLDHHLVGDVEVRRLPVNMPTNIDGHTHHAHKKTSIRIVSAGRPLREQATRQREPPSSTPASKKTLTMELKQGKTYQVFRSTGHE